MNRLKFVLILSFTISCVGHEKNAFIVNEYIHVDSLPIIDKSKFKVN